jgi:hypothetical protein
MRGREKIKLGKSTKSKSKIKEIVLNGGDVEANQYRLVWTREAQLEFQQIFTEILESAPSRAIPFDVIPQLCVGSAQSHGAVGTTALHFPPMTEASGLTQKPLAFLNLTPYFAARCSLAPQIYRQESNPDAVSTRKTIEWNIRYR